MKGTIPKVFEKDLIDGTAVQIGKDNAVLADALLQDLFSLGLKAGFLNGLFKNDDVSGAENSSVSFMPDASRPWAAMII